MKKTTDKKQKKRKSVQDLIGAAGIEDSCLAVSSGERLCFIMITPVNLNVLSSINISSRITKMTDTLENIGTVDFLCLNSSQSYDSNKHYLAKLKERETNDTLRDLDQKDIEFFDQVRISMATSREFLAVLRFSVKDTTEQIQSTMGKVVQVFKDNGMIVRLAAKPDIKRMLAIYLEQNIFETEMQDFDGESYAELLEMKL
ncbi:hypothetical protein [Caproiciproducens faecalis]|uniref:Uncharacterized protein n=1 Tax=Caproiciproducens faecalis TaxID=2820301 RepID=A0ABS7DRG4_9FIRM|nr:hypothetical protein [Caproiciproducens faecalis]MBW7573166.1 hypothetical protein [Caproiciproducens faecalis]